MASDGKIKVVAELDVSKYQAQLKKMQVETKGTANNLQSSLSKSLNQATLGLGPKLSEGIKSALNEINQLPRTIASGMSSVLDGIKSGISSLPSTLGGAFNALKTGVSGVVDKMRDVGSVGVSAGKQALEAFKGLASTCGSLVGSLAKVAAKVTAVGAAAAAAGLAKVFKDATKEMGEFQQQIGGTDKLFGDASRKVQANAANAFRTAGMSANDYMKEVTLYSGALIRGLGGDTNKAADYADKAIKQMSDNVNTFGSSTASVQYAYRGFARQQYTMLDNLRLGYGGTREEMARLVNDSGVMGENFKATAKNIDEVSFDKIVDAIGVIQDRLKVTGTTAQEAERTLQGAQRAMAASWKNWLTALGDQGKEGALNIDVYTKRLVSSVSTYLQNLGPIVKGVAMGLQNSLPDLAKAIQDALPSIISAVTNVLNLLVSMTGVLLPYVIQIVQSLINALVAQLPMILPTLVDAIIAVAIGLVQTLGQIITAIVNFFTIPANVQKLVDAFVTLLTTIALAIPQMLTALAQAVPSIVETLTKPENVMAILNAGVKLFTELVKAIPKILPSLVSAFGALLSNLWTSVRGLFTKIGMKAGDAIGGAIKGAINGALGFIEGALNTPINLINGALDLINKLPGVKIGKLKTLRLPRIATGGLVQGVGTGTSDSNLAWLSRGEYVVKADTVRRYGVEFMDALNSGRLVGGGGMTQNYYYQFDRNANSRWQYQQIRTGAAA